MQKPLKQALENYRQLAASLEKIGVAIVMQSGLQQLGFGAEEADLIQKIPSKVQVTLLPTLPSKLKCPPSKLSKHVFKRLNLK